MRRGRPVGSIIRQRMVDILYLLGKAHGYDIYKYYKEIHPPITLRVIYYHLRKGAILQEFHLEHIEQERGNYSWGQSAEKIYYSIGPQARPRVDELVKDQIEKLKAKFLLHSSMQIKKTEQSKHAAAVALE